MTLAVRSFLYQQIDRELGNTALSLAAQSPPSYAGLRGGTVIIETDEKGNLVRSPVVVQGRGDYDHDTDDNPSSQKDGTLTSDDIASLVESSGSAATLSLDHLGKYRALEIDSSLGKHLVVALPLTQVDETLGRLLLIEGLALAGAVLVVAIGGGWLIRHDLLPLDRVAKTAKRVATLPLGAGTPNLDERVPAVAPGTEIGDVSEAMNEMLDHMQASLEVRAETEHQLRQFVADASHELRTPLASIRGYSELYRRHDVDEAGRQNAMGRIESEAGRMGTLVDDLLLLARLDQGRPLEHRSVDLVRLAAEASTDMSVTHPHHPVSVDLPSTPITVLGDEDRLRQVLANLLSNAVQHTPQGTHVRVAVRGLGTRVQLEVADDGPGVDPDFLPHVFERFTRADESRARASGGSGLGLSIVAAVASALGGIVTVDSRPGQTTFLVDLPAEPSATR